MTDPQFVPLTDFNVAMQSLRSEFREDLGGIREEIGGLRELLQGNLNYRIDQARENAELAGRLRVIEDKQTSHSKITTGISISLGGLLFWKFLELAMKR